jgi:hypothetical protein
MALIAVPARQGPRAHLAARVDHALPIKVPADSKKKGRVRLPRQSASATCPVEGSL